MLLYKINTNQDGVMLFISVYLFCLLVSPIRRYDEITSNGLVRSDPGQREVIKKLDDLWYELRQYKPKAYKEQGKSRSVSYQYGVGGGGHE